VSTTRIGRVVPGLLLLPAAVMAATNSTTVSRAADSDTGRPVVMVVSDPLAAELSCPCVAGYAQRDYDVLAEHVAGAIGRDVTVVYGDSIARAAGGDAEPADIVIGKRSVMAAEAIRAKRPLQPVAELTDLDGDVTQRGLVVVHGEDSARRLEDLRDHLVVLGPSDCEEKHAAARTLFAAHDITVPETCAEEAGCTQAAERVLTVHREGGRPVAAVISSYATPLLEGCGTINKGELRVVAETAPVPFITAFVDVRLDAATRREIIAALRDVADEPAVRLAIESQAGFRMLPDGPADTTDWPGWRGTNRDAVVAWLPDRLADPPRIAWTCPLFNEGVGGVAAAAGLVLVGDRDAEDVRDVFHAIDAGTGLRLWSLEYEAGGNLDYGNSPRATPLVHAGHAYLLGAFGDLHCVRLEDGEIVWRRHLRDDFDVTSELVWGVSSSPLVVDGKLILNPGGPEASLVALDPATGDVLWQTPGAAAAYASLVVAAPGGTRQLVGFDAASCGGWDIATGKRLWSLTPRVAGDFNVPTPLVIGARAVFVSENNGARAVGLDEAGQPRIEAAFARLDPDMHSPVACAGRIFGVHKGRVTCLDADTLAPVWVARDRLLGGHVSLIASADRMLVCTQEGELVLIDARADRLEIISRCRVLGDDCSTLAHPAIADRKLFVRGPGVLVCVDLEPSAVALR
jgi:outer membrane protein assembly factor BamB